MQTTSVHGYRRHHTNESRLTGSGFERFRNLIGARRSLVPAPDAFELLYDILDLHALNEGFDALKIAAASADDLKGLENPVFDFECHIFGTDALGRVFDMHGHTPS